MAAKPSRSLLDDPDRVVLATVNLNSDAGADILKLTEVSRDVVFCKFISRILKHLFGRRDLYELS